MSRFLAFMLCLALAPFAWADDEEKDQDKDLKALRDRILERISKQLDKEFDRIREEVKALLDKELGVGKEEKKPAKKEEKKAEKQPKKAEKKQPEEKGTEKPASHEKKPGWMGVQLAMDEESGLPAIQAIFPETPAEKAGLQEGDIFVKLDGKDLESVEALIGAVQEAGAGAKLKVTVRRGGEEMDITIKLDERPEQPEMPMEPEDEGEDLGEDEK
ncbi:MAG: PDZ domain-containing protein [Planctomycetota bacterium]